MLVTILRYASFGISEIFGKFNAYAHDVVELSIKCQNCKTKMFQTMEFSMSGTSKRWGRYLEQTELHSRLTGCYEYVVAQHIFIKKAKPAYAYNLS